MKRKTFNFIGLLVLVASIFVSCSLVNNESIDSVLQVPATRAAYDMNRVPSQDPPNGLTTAQTPQFLIIGYDDNQFADGMENILAIYESLTNPAGNGNPLTYDGTKTKASFYVTPSGRDIATGETWQVGADTVQSWKRAYQLGHEVGNHTWFHEHGLQFTVARWKEEMTKTNDFLVNIVGMGTSSS